MNDKGVKFRIGLTVAVLMLAVMGLGVRLAFLHLLTDTEVRKQIKYNRRIKVDLTAPRGKILDCSVEGNILALNLVMKDVCADPLVIANSATNPAEMASILAERLEMPADEVEKRLTRPESQFVFLRRFMPEEQASGIAAMGLRGVFLQDNPVRYYPQGSFMCHVLGFVNHEGDGSAGIEQHMERFLKGSAGYMESGVDARRRELYMMREQYVPPVEGGNVTLTVDQNIQDMVEKVLDDTVKQYNAKGGWVIVQRVQTGEILAMASRPGYDLNDFRSSTDDQRLNRAIGFVFEPGSTFKAITISAALNEGIVTPDTVFDCENGLWIYKKRPLRDYHPYGRLSVADGLKKSSNILTAKVAVSLGEKMFYGYMRGFSIGRQMGIDLPGEEVGILHPVSKWSNISITRMAIGQGVAVTALQMLSVFSTIANDGYTMKPFIIRRVESSDGSLLYSGKPEIVGRPVTRETAATMRKLLAGVTEEGGTGRSASVEGVAVAGKTGSAQKPVAGGYSDSAHVASFAGFFPAEAPQIAAIVVIDEPQPVRTGGRVAAPAFGRIADQVVRYLEVAPDSPIIARR